MNSTILVGFAVCSRNNGALDTGVFDNVSVTGLWPALPAIPANLISVPGDTSAFLNWSPAANATGYNLKRANVSGGPYTTVATNWNSLIFTNTGLVNGTLYYYVVQRHEFLRRKHQLQRDQRTPRFVCPPQLGFMLNGNQVHLAWPLDHLGCGIGGTDKFTRFRSWHKLVHGFWFDYHESNGNSG